MEFRIWNDYCSFLINFGKNIFWVWSWAPPRGHTENNSCSIVRHFHTFHEFFKRDCHLLCYHMLWCKTEAWKSKKFLSFYGDVWRKRLSNFDDALVSSAERKIELWGYNHLVHCLFLLCKGYRGRDFTCDFEDAGMCGWTDQSLNAPAYSWERRQRGEVLPDSGPSSDYNIGTATGKDPVKDPDLSFCYLSPCSNGRINLFLLRSQHPEPSGSSPWGP